MNNKFYIYRFLDKNDDILYIGRTNDINRRLLKEHFTSLGHLPIECYKFIEKIQYAKFENESEDVAYEAILINKLRPKYNIQFKDCGNFNVVLPKFQWIDFELPYEYCLQYLKNRKDKVQSVKDFIINQAENLSLDKPFDSQLIKTGFRPFDEINPIRNTDFILVAGDSFSGKTTYALNICKFVATNLNKKVLYVNLREDANSLTDKLISSKSNIPLERIKRRLFTDEDIILYSNAVNELYDSNIQFTNLKYEDKNIDKIINVIKSSPYDLIIIDDLQSIVNNKNEYIKDKTIDIMQKLKSFTLDIMTPLILVTEISSKSLILRNDHCPRLSDFQYDSMKMFPDIIKLLYRKEIYNDDTLRQEDKNILEVNVAKSCFGSGYTMRFAFLEKMFTIGHIAKE
ncbi:DnaB-like helicase C-terminal domain-containing protein [Clostridium tetani]|uniref:GIY-YIG domain-containing protein n=1 Tax=Clostridium tetani TaxID=1513 RepID=A0ABC8EDV9_CLOTA|nr:DnaB-like helicase C-terminal domain-containing protein [Clostridium tetani]BDR81035.1 hypothetical protein K234311028_12810 [Clostridium tetani]